MLCVHAAKRDDSGLPDNFASLHAKAAQAVIYPNFDGLFNCKRLPDSALVLLSQEVLCILVVNDTGPVQRCRHPIQTHMRSVSLTLSEPLLQLTRYL